MIDSYSIIPNHTQSKASYYYVTQFLPWTAKGKCHKTISQNSWCLGSGFLGLKVNVLYVCGAKLRKWTSQKTCPGVSDLQTIISIFSKSENGLFPTLGVQWPCTCTWPGCSKSLHATRLDIESICDGWNLEARCQLPLRMCVPYTGKGCPDRQEKRSSFPSYYNFDVGQLCPWM